MNIVIVNRSAEDMNIVQFQSKMDFMVGAYGVDVKASRLRSAGARSKTLRRSGNASSD